MTLDLRKLRHATVLAAERSFVRAAARLHITQSALSQSIARLEQELGLILFDRLRSGVVLTSAGKDLLERAGELLLAERGLAHELSLMRAGQLGRVSFGMTPIPAQVWLRQLLPRIISNEPSLEVHVQLATSSHLLEQLLLDRIEFFMAVAANVKAASELAIRFLARFSVGFFVRGGHALAHSDKVSVEELKAHPVLSLPIPDVSQSNHLRWLGLSKASALPISVTADDSAALKDLALATDAVLILPHALIADELAAGKLVELPVKGLRHEGSVDVCLVSLARRTPSPAAAMIISQLEGQIADRRLQKFVSTTATRQR